MLYWGSAFEFPSQPGRGIEILTDVAMAIFTGKPVLRDPARCRRTNVPERDREELAAVLAQGVVLERYMGHANCRICGLELGSADLTGWGFMWPEKAEHYILVHLVWTPDCDRLLQAVRTT